ncbi:interaptin-like isoform X3 [Lytechinus pictus]|uniref:interaptin-like isoform X3 n=3 Tax=Lytechinus pictus TaxID=7653 RepID=UPI0030B9EF8E
MSVAVELQELLFSISKTQEEALNQPKGWASDSEDERDLTKSLSRTSGYLDQGPEFEMTEVASNVTSLSQPREPGWDLDTLGDDREIKSGLSSRQPSSIRKQELQSRQSTDASIKPTPPGTPKSLDPPKPKNINKVTEDDTSRNKTGTPKKAMRTKSNLEPVHEVPFEEKIPLEEEERWSKVPQEQLPSAFKQYRKEALFIVQGLQEKIKTNQEDNHKKIRQLRNHIQVKEEKWDKERNTLVHQVDAAREAEREAEKEADNAVAQLESFVKEHEETTKNAIKQEQKALKTLTPEQRAKYLGEFNPMEMVKPIKEEKPEEVEKEEEGKKEESELHGEKDEIEKENNVIEEETEVKEQKEEEKFEQDKKDKEDEAPEMADQNTQMDPLIMVEQEQQTSRIQSRLDGEDELDRPLSASSHHSQQSLYEKFRAQLEQRKQEIVERRSRATSMHGSLLSAKSGSYRDQAPSRDSSAVLTPQGDIQFPDEEYEDPGEVLKSSAESSTRPHPHREQPSAAISHQDQMSQARLSTAGYQGRVSSHLISRAPSVSESGVSMLETDEEGGYTADEEEAVGEALPRFIATATSAKLFDVDKLDMATSPVAYSTVSKSSRQSIESIADHPVVQDYLKTYQHITDFKENVIKLVYDKEFGAALEQLAEIKTLQFDRDSNVQSQVSHMTYNVETFLKEIISVFGTVMTTPEPEAAISSLMVSRADTGKSRMGGLGFQLQSAAEAIQEGVQEGLDREMTDMTFQSSERIKGIQENYDRLKQEASKQQMDYEDKLNNNTVMMMEMQNTIQDLQQELQALGGSKAMSSPSRVSTATANRDLQVEPTIIFSRSDSERNQRALKRGISAQKVSAEQYNEAVRAMEQYTVLPAKRLVHIVRKYSHHTEMKKIEDDVRHSNSIDQEVYTLLERMETLQSKRAQRWGEEMDNLTAERNRLAHLLMDTLTHLEQESGIFMIKPILSWKGRGFQPHYQSKLSSYQPPKRLLRPITPEERKGTPFTVVPAPTPANQGTKAGYRPGTRTSSGTPGGGDAHRLYTPSGHIPNGGASLKGSAVQMVGEVPQPMWSMNTSIPTQGGEGTGTVGGGLTGRLNFMTTPRLLELDVNRLLIGQNIVSAATKALLSNDRLVNAANSSVRSYVTIARPSTHPPVPNLRPSRPNSSSEAEKGQTTPRSPPPQTSSSAGPHGRSRSEGALQMSQPLPPIKVPSNNNEEDDNRTGKDTGGSGYQVQGVSWDLRSD